MARGWKYYKKLNARRQQQTRSVSAVSMSRVIIIPADEGKSLLDEIYTPSGPIDFPLLNGEIGVLTTFSLKRSLDLTLATR